MKESKELHNKSKKDAPEQVETTNSGKELITPHANNVSATCVLFDELITLRDDYVNNSKEEEERRERLFTSIVNIYLSPISRQISSYLHKQGAVTQPELIENIPTTGATVSRTLNTLRRCGIVEKRGTVGDPYRVHTDRGAGIPIWSLKNAGPEASIEAQKRYGEIIKKEIEYIQQEKQIDVERIEAEAASKQRMMEDDLRRVLEILKPPIDRMSLIYDAFNKFEIDNHESRSYIKKYFEDETVKIKVAQKLKEAAG